MMKLMWKAGKICDKYHLTLTRVLTMSSNIDIQFFQAVPKLFASLNKVSNEEAKLRGCQPFYVENKQVGLIRPDHLQHLTFYKDVFVVVEDMSDAKLKPGVHISPDLKTYDERSKAVNGVLEDLRQKDKIASLRGWRHENYKVSQGFKEKAFMEVERAGSGVFGFIQYGVHVNGYTKQANGDIKMWIGRRSKTKPTFPDMYDNMCAGGLAADLDLEDCVRKECKEEASVPDKLLDNLKFVGTISYFYEDERGLFPECQFVFDLEVDEDFVPINSDGEVSSFEKLSINEVKGLISGDNFKPNCAAVCFDFFLRHGFLSPKEPNIGYYVERLHAPLQTMYRGK